MKYYRTILALIMLAGISAATNIVIDDGSFYCQSTTNYDWTLNKTANNYELVFSPAPDPVPQSVLFTISITRSAPYSQTFIDGHVHLYNAGTDPATITNVAISIYHLNWATQDSLLLKTEIIYSGSYLLGPGLTYTIPFHIPFITTGDITVSLEHYFITSVIADGITFLSPYRNYFHASPNVVNETLHVWDEYTVPTGFTTVPTWNPAYNGSYWATVSGNATLTLGLAITNQSAPIGSFVLKNKGSGINECGLWEDSVLITLRDTTPPDTGFHGTTLTPGYWKNHPNAYRNWLPITFCGITVSNTNQGYTILSRSGNSSSPWYKFLCHFFCTILNTKNSPGILNAYYNDMTKTGEFMEGQQVAYIFSVANSYNSSTPGSTLLAMKDVCDAMNQDNQHVLWNTPSGGSGSTVSLRNSSSITLYPNPFSSRTEIRFSTNNNEPVTLKVYDISGTKVRDLVKNGNSTLYWDGTDNNGKLLTRGVYIIRANNTTLKALINR